MKSRSYIMFWMFLLIHQSLLPKFDIKGMLKGMGQSFGAPPLGYTYSFDVWNDASVPIYIEQQGLASFMGAYFPSAKGYYGRKRIPSIFEAQEGENHKGNTKARYYFNLFLGTGKHAHKHDIYKQSLTQLPLAKHDPNVYYYHVYTSNVFSKGRSNHEPKVEMMGYQNPKELDKADSKKKGSVAFTTQLSDLSFYNSSEIDVQVALKYDKENYVFTLEKYSHNTLSIPTSPEKKSPQSAITAVSDVSNKALSPESTGDSLSSLKSDEVITQGLGSVRAKGKVAAKTTTTAQSSAEKQKKETGPPPLFSLRPNILSFSSYDKSTQKYIQFRSFLLQSKGFEGAPYTIEVFQDPGKSLEVGIQGFNPGNYDIPTTSRVRDITPCPCTFWYKSFEQAGSIKGYSNLPGQMWVVYTGVDSPIQMKVIPGQAVEWNLVRPLVDQGDQYVYFVYIATSDDKAAEVLVKKIASRVIGQNVLNQYEKIVNTSVVLSATNTNLDITDDATKNINQSLTSDQQVAALMGNLKIDQGVIEDVDQGIVAYIVGADVFTPSGLGFGRFHYVLDPSVMSMNNLVSLLYGSLDSLKISSFGSSDTAIQSVLNGKINDWFIAYMQEPVDVQQEVKQFLIMYGNAKIVDVESGDLTKFGQFRLQDIMTGPNSLKFPSMKLSTVTNHYVYDFGKSVPDKMPIPIKIQMDKKNKEED